MWGSGDEENLFETSSDNETSIGVVEANQVALIASNLTPGSTIAAKGASEVLVAPTF